MLTRFARLSTNHARAVVIAAVVVFAVAGALGGGVADHLTSGGFDDPSSESERADEALAERFDTGVPNLLLLVTARDGDVDNPAVEAAGQALTAELAAEDGVADVVSYWSEGNAPPLRNDDGSRALVVARVEGNDDQVEDRVTELAPRYEHWAGRRRRLRRHQRRAGRLRRGVPRGGRHHRGGPGSSRDDRPADHAGAADPGVRQRGGRLAAVGHRRDVDHRNVLRAAGAGGADRRVDLCPEPHDRARPGPRDRLQLVRGVPLPGGAAGRDTRPGSP